MHRPSTQEAISGDRSRRARRGVPSGRLVFIKPESYSFVVRGDRRPFSCGLRVPSAATPPPLASRALDRGPDSSSSVAAGSIGAPAALTALTGAPTLPAAKEAPVEDESYLGNLGQPIKLHWEKYRPAMYHQLEQSGKLH